MECTFTHLSVGAERERERERASERDRELQAPSAAITY